jgi:hypothetical protein
MDKKSLKIRAVENKSRINWGVFHIINRFINRSGILDFEKKKSFLYFYSLCRATNNLCREIG